MALSGIVTDLRLDAVLQTSLQSRDQAASLVALLQTADETPGALNPEHEAELSKQQKLLLANISHLRGLHRAAHLSARETKAQTSEARQELDRLHLQLQNLYYEQRHLQGEISDCETYEYVFYCPWVLSSPFDDESNERYTATLIRTFPSSRSSSFSKSSLTMPPTTRMPS